MHFVDWYKAAVSKNSFNLPAVCHGKPFGVNWGVNYAVLVYNLRLGTLYFF